MTRKARRRAVSVGLLLAACKPQPDTTPARPALACLERGTVLLAADVSVEASRPCSGVLIAPNVVLTALHCLAQFNDSLGFRCETNGSLAPAATGGWIGPPLDPRQLHVYWGERPFDGLSLGYPAHYEPTAYGRAIVSSGATQACVDDIGLLVLDRSLPVPPLALELDRRVELGDSLTVIGYDAEGSAGAGGMSEQWVRRTWVGSRVTEVGPDTAAEPESTRAPRTFAAVNANEGVVPPGFIGAPALLETTGKVVGVVARGGTISTHTQVSPYAKWIADALDELDARPATEPQRCAGEENAPLGFGEGGASPDAARPDPARWELCRTICRKIAAVGCWGSTDAGSAGSADPDVPANDPTCVEDACTELDDDGTTCPRKWEKFLACFANLPDDAFYCSPDGPSYDGCVAESKAFEECVDAATHP